MIINMSYASQVKNYEFDNIENYCEFIRKTLHTKFPIYMFKVLDKLEIKYMTAKFKIDAIYNDNILFYNKKASKDRTNFALARELLKALLPDIYTSELGNEFSWELLIPAKHFTHLYKDGENNKLFTPKELAKYFNVNTQTINSRGKMLGLWE